MARRARVDTTADSSSSKFSTRMFRTRRRHVGLGLEQRDGSVPEIPQALVHGLQQIVGLLFPQHDVGVANDAEQMRASNAHAREELAEIQPDDVLEQRKRLARASRHRRRNRDEAREDVGDLHARELRRALVLDHDGEALASARNVGKRVASIESQRCERGADVGAKVVRQIRRHLGRVLGAFEKMDAGRRQQRKEPVSPAAGDGDEDAARACAHGLQLLLDGQSVGGPPGEASPVLSRERGDPDHEELVQVVRRDRQKLHTLEQGMRVALRVSQHALVEREPAELPVDVQPRIAAIDRVAGVGGRRMRWRRHRDAAHGARWIVLVVHRSWGVPIISIGAAAVEAVRLHGIYLRRRPDGYKIVRTFTKASPHVFNRAPSRTAHPSICSLCLAAVGLGVDASGRSRANQERALRGLAPRRTRGGRGQAGSRKPDGERLAQSRPAGACCSSRSRPLQPHQNTKGRTSCPALCVSRQARSLHDFGVN